VSTSIGIGFNQSLDMLEAAKTAAFESKTKLKEDRIDTAIVFSTIHYDHQKCLPIINRILNSPNIIGCSTAGIITSNAVKTQGIAVLTITSDEMKFGITASEEIITADTLNLGERIAKDSIKSFGQHPRKAFLFFMDDGLHHTSDLLKGMQNIFGNVFSIIGAGSSDDFHFEETFQLYNNQVLKKSLVGMLMGGQMNISVGGRHGWRPLGKPRIISEVNGNILRRIDGKSAVSLYEDYFGEHAEDIRNNKLGQMAILYPLGIYVDGGHEYLLRNAVDIQPDGSIVCQGDLPQGAEVHLMIGNKESCVAAAREAALEAKKNLLGKKAKLIIIIECLSRLKLLGRGAFGEISKVKDVFGGDVPIIGMYSNGEICPFQTLDRYKKSHHQNESIIVLALG